jgi:SAM-dependent methyltransferase
MRFRLFEILRETIALFLRGKRFYCPLCAGSYRRFLPAGTEKRPNARCPRCESLERHRLLWVALNKLWDCGQFTRGGKLLHIAPEKPLADKFKNSYSYLSADLDGSKAMVSMDITNIAYPDNSFDVIICNHVLEHIPRDRTALDELYRVLKCGGWGAIQVPIAGEVTIEGAHIDQPAERARLFGQADHVRQYGNDFVDRLKAAGFGVTILDRNELLSHEDQLRLSVTVERNVMFVTKN